MLSSHLLAHQVIDHSNWEKYVHYSLVRIGKPKLNLAIFILLCMLAWQYHAIHRLRWKVKCIPVLVGWKASHRWICKATRNYHQLFITFLARHTLASVRAWSVLDSVPVDVAVTIIFSMDMTLPWSFYTSAASLKVALAKTRPDLK